MFFFSKYFAKIKKYLFPKKISKGFSNFSKTTQYFFLVVFGPLRRAMKTSLENKSRKKSEFYRDFGAIFRVFWCFPSFLEDFERFPAF